MRRATPSTCSWANDNNPGQDWHVTFQYPVFVLYHLGFISAGMELHYHFEHAFEVMWTPYGVSSNLCRGVARPAYAGREGHAAAVRRLPGDDLGRQGRRLQRRPVRRQPADQRVDHEPERAVRADRRRQRVGRQPVRPRSRSTSWSADDGVPNPGQLWCTASETFPGTSTPSARAFTRRPSVRRRSRPTIRASRTSGSGTRADGSQLDLAQQIQRRCDAVSVRRVAGWGAE